MSWKGISIKEGTEAVEGRVQVQFLGNGNRVP